MKKAIAILFAIMAILPAVLANDTGIGIGIDISVEDFEPRIWMCDNRYLIDDDIQPGRVDGVPVWSEEFETCECVYEGCVTGCVQGQASISFECDGTPCEVIFDETWELPQQCVTFCEQYTVKWGCEIEKGYELYERHNNYAFEGEKIEWLVLVMDKNKIEQVSEVVATVGAVQGTGNPVEVECVELNGFAAPGAQILPECNARIDEEQITQFDDQIMAYYECTLTVETPASMHGEYWVTVEAMDASGLSAIVDENEFWFFNPTIALTIDGLPLAFGTVRPGTVAYSSTLTVGNGAELGSGVMLDMFISGTDFYDPSNSGARCVITNRLKLGNNYVSGSNNGADPVLDVSANKCKIGFTDTDDHLCYHATSGAYSTGTDPRKDAEGYAPIVYGNAFTRDFYNDAELIQAGRMGAYWMGNMLSPGSEMSVTFKLGLPLPCVGDFSAGSLYFWGEAV